MKTYIALLRGINVSGKNKILMKDLKLLFEGLKFEHIITYIQSGNVIFKTDIKRNLLSHLIFQEIKNNYNYTVSVIIKTPNEIKNAVKNNPFLKEENVDLKKLAITYFNKAPLDTTKLDAYDFGKDLYVIQNDIMYLKYNSGVGRSKLTPKIVENKLGVITTSRNWRTTNKLIELTKD